MFFLSVLQLNILDLVRTDLMKLIRYLYESKASKGIE